MTEKDSMVTPGQRLREARLYFGKKQEDFGQALGSDQTYISRLENGREPIGDDIYYRLEKEFGLSRQWILAGEGEMLLNKGAFDAAKREQARKLTKGVTVPSSMTQDNIVRGNLLVVSARDQGIFLRRGLDAPLSRVSFPFIQGEAVAFEITGNNLAPAFMPSSYVVTTVLESIDYMIRDRPYVVITGDLICTGYYKGMTKEGMLLGDASDTVKILPPADIHQVYYIELRIGKL